MCTIEACWGSVNDLTFILSFFKYVSAIGIPVFKKPPLPEVKIILFGSSEKLSGKYSKLKSSL